MLFKLLIFAALLGVRLAIVQATPTPEAFIGHELDGDEWPAPMMKRCSNTECTMEPHGPGHRRKKYQGIDFSQARGRAYVRFVLASSVGFPKTNSTPLVIDTQQCMSGTWSHALNDTAAVDADYNTHLLRLYKLVDDPAGARNCQSYYMRNAGGGNWIVKKHGGYPIAVTIANDTKSTIGWDMSSQGNISWVKTSQYNELSGQLYADCKSWWKNYPGKVRYYGRNCLLKVRNSADTDLCIAAAPASDDLENRKVIAMPCGRSKKRQLWHLQSTATEYPDYLGTCGQECWGKRYNKAPIQFYQVTGKYLLNASNTP